jgi:hypothetical protein
VGEHGRRAALAALLESLDLTEIVLDAAHDAMIIGDAGLRAGTGGYRRSRH